MKPYGINHMNNYRLLAFVESRPMIVLKLGNLEREVAEEAKDTAWISPEVESAAKPRRALSLSNNRLFSLNTPFVRTG